MNRTDEPEKKPIPFGLNGNREPLLENTPSGDNTASYNLGFPPVTMILKAAGGLPPKGQDMNQILYELSTVARWANAGALYRFDPDFSSSINGYPSGSVIIGDDGITIFISRSDGNTNNPNTDPTNWFNLTDGYLKTANNLSEIQSAGPAAVAAARSNLGLTDVLVGPLAQTTGASTTAIMSQKAVTDALATKQPSGNYANGQIFASSAAETYVFNPNKNLYFLINYSNISGAYSVDFGLIWGFDSAGAMTAGTVPVSRVTGLSQAPGASTTEIMSQKAVTDAIGQNASIGLYQIWHDVTASRAAGSSYTNNSNRPIVVAMNVKNVPLGLFASSIVVQGIEFSTGSTTAGEHRFISVIVPPGQTYIYNPLATSNYTLLELY